MNFKSLSRFVKYLLTHHAIESFAYISLSLFTAILDASTALLVAPIFDLLMKSEPSINSAQNTSNYTIYAFKIADYYGLPHTALTMMVLFLIIVFFRNVFMVISESLSISIKEKTVYHLKIHTFKSILYANWDFFLNRNQGDFLNTLTREVMRTQNAFVYFSRSINYFLQVFLFLIVALSVSWQLTLACAFFSFSLVVPFIFLTRFNFRWGQKSANYASKANSIIQETFSMAKVIQSFSNQTIILERLVKTQKKLLDTTFFSESLTSFIQNAYYPLGLASIIIGYYLSLQFGLSFSELSIILFALWKSIPLLSTLIRQISAFTESLPSFDKVIELQNAAIAQPLVSGEETFLGLSRQIQFKDVHLRYEARANDVLKNINIKIPKGQMIALVGHSGSGKSSLVDLTMGFHLPSSGTIYVDDLPLNQLILKSFREKIGYVPQSSALFNTSIRNNFLWIKPEFSEADILWACEQAYALEFIDQLPDGLDTIVGDRGIRLSGGQVQRLALARAIVLRPELLILDEATSALDSESELYIQKSIDKLSQDMTILVIAHRLSTIKKADYIYVLEHGEIIEEGKPIELENLNGHFKAMLAEQNF